MATTVTIPDDKDTRKKLAQLRWQKEARMARQWLFENRPDVFNSIRKKVEKIYPRHRDARIQKQED